MTNPNDDTVMNHVQGILDLFNDLLPQDKPGIRSVLVTKASFHAESIKRLTTPPAPAEAPPAEAPPAEAPAAEATAPSRKKNSKA